MARSATKNPPRLEQLLPGSLLWRTFLLITLLLLVSLAAWIVIIDVAGREQRARAIAQQVASIVNLTRAALVTAAPEKRLGLLRELSQREGIRIYAAGEQEPVVDLPDSQMLQLITVDPHSPAEFRANIVRNLDEFHEVYDTTEGDGLWLDPEDRVRIW